MIFLKFIFDFTSVNIFLTKVFFINLKLFKSYIYDFLLIVEEVNLSITFVKDVLDLF